MKTREALYLSLLLTCLSPAAVRADAEWPELDSTQIVEASVPMRDGVALVADIILPVEGERWPAVLTPNPYNSRQDPEQIRERLIADAGYAVVHLNVRGRHGSGGQYRPFLHEIPDLEDLLAWVLGQPWCDGRVALVGSSSQSYSNQLLAATGHPAIKTLVNLSGLTDTEALFFPGGAFRLDTLYPWLQFFYVQKPIRDLEEWDRRYRMLPLSQAFEWEPGLLDRMAAASVDVESIDVPILHVTGWNDVVYRQVLTHYRRQLRRPNGPEQRLIVGPWMHNHVDSGHTEAGEEDYGAMAAQDVRTLHRWITDWLDAKVKGLDRGRDFPPARIFVMGADSWHEHSAWPPPGSSSRTLFLDGAGALVETTPASEASSSFVYDPEDPVPTWGGVNSHLFAFRAGPRDQARLAERPDVLRFRSRPAESAYVLAGPVRATLFAQSDAPDTDFTAKLSLVRTDGTVWVLEDGIQRARFREGRHQELWLEPDQVVELELDLGEMARRVGVGEALQLDISSSNFPKYDRNPNVRAEPFEATESRPATQTIHHSTRYPSRLVVTVHP